MPTSTPELKKYLEKRVEIEFTGSRRVEGVLRGFDLFLNVTLADAIEITPDGKRAMLGDVVMRGKTIVLMEAMERIADSHPPREGGGYRGPR